jgi:ribosome-associated protein
VQAAGAAGRQDRAAGHVPARRAGARSTLTGGLRITRDIELPLDEITLRTSRSSGPGGQHANVTASRVEAVFDVAASNALDETQKARVMARSGPRVTAAAQDTRSQARNRELALQRLASRLAAALAVRRPRHATKPSKGAVERRLEEKRRQSRRKAERRRNVDE